MSGAPETPTSDALTSDAEAPTSRPRSERAEHAVATVGLVLLATCLALVSLTYPHGRDQATHGYIGLRWLEGAVPYRDTFDIKPPGVFFAHTVGYALFGRTPFAIRALDLLVSILPSGLLLGLATRPRSTTGGDRTRHVATVMALYVMLYFGTFDYWCSAQSETWCNLVTSIAIHSAATSSHASRATRVLRRRAAFVQGIGVGLMLLFKPPALVVSLGCIAFLIHAQRGPTHKDTARNVLEFALMSLLGATMVLAPVLAYFASKGALGAMFDVLVTTTARYAKTGSTAASFVDSIGELLMAFATFNGLPLFLIVGAVLRLRPGGAQPDAAMRYRLGLGLVGAAAVAVAAQRKFFLYHWLLELPPLTFLMGTALQELSEKRSKLKHLSAPRPLHIALLAAVVLLVGGDGTDNVLRVLARGPAFVSSRNLEALDPAFEDPGHYSVSEYRALARHITAHSAPTDDVLVRGFEPQLYLMAGRRYHGRHFWSLFVSGSVFSQPEHFRDEDCRAFLSAPPKLVLAFNTDRPAIEASRSYEGMGYRKIAVVAVFDVLERDIAVLMPTECPW